jgi:hypothetical protein
MALRRNQRLRREYLYAKSLEGKEKDMYERKQRIKAALAGECGKDTAYCGDATGLCMVATIVGCCFDI